MGFIAFTHVTLLNNAWQAVANVAENPETMRTLRNVGDDDDGEVAKDIETDEKPKEEEIEGISGQKVG